MLVAQSASFCSHQLSRQKGKVRTRLTVNVFKYSRFLIHQGLSKKRPSMSTTSFRNTHKKKVIFHVNMLAWLLSSANFVVSHATIFSLKHLL